MSAPQSGLTGRLRELLIETAQAYAGTPEQRTIHELLSRMDDPLRIAIAGRVKAGKSTLLNALIGERLAATDAGECTRIVTWYRNGSAVRAWAHPRGAPPRQIPFDRIAGRTVPRLGNLTADQLDRLVVETPSSRLARLTLIDTPGIGSLSAEISARTTDALTPGADAGPAPPVADAVLFLMRHLHSTDVSFLEAFHGGAPPVAGGAELTGHDPAAVGELAGVTPINAIGVLSRADEIGAGRTDALEIADRIAAGYRRDPRVRGLVQTVVPVAGLLGQAGGALTERDYSALHALAFAGTRTDALLLTADRFTSAAPGTVVGPAVRAALLTDLGLSGLRLSIALIRGGLAGDGGTLAAELRRRSGLDRLREVLLSQFTQRRDVLKAQAALHTVERLLATRPVPAADRLRARLESVVASAHELVELRLLNDLRTGVLELPDDLDSDQRDEVEALLGVAGDDARARLRLPPEAPEAAVRPAVLAALRRWQRRGESPTTDPATRRLAGVLRRSCEGLLRSAAPARG